MKDDRHAEIAQRAYQIWENEGRPNDRALDHWLEAEAEGRHVVDPRRAKPAKRARARRKEK